MKSSHGYAAAVVTALGLGIAAGAGAHPGQAGGGMEQHGGMHHAMKGAGHGAMSDGAGHGAGQQRMTPEERATFREKMHNAATPEERQRIAEANRAEMRKRAQEQGVTPPEHRGPHAGHGSRMGAPERAQ